MELEDFTVTDNEVAVLQSSGGMKNLSVLSRNNEPISDVSVGGPHNFFMGYLFAFGGIIAAHSNPKLAIPAVAVSGIAGYATAAYRSKKAFDEGVRNYNLQMNNMARQPQQSF